jgi:hypothetical protein
METTFSSSWRYIVVQQQLCKPGDPVVALHRDAVIKICILASAVELIATLRELQ